MAKHMCVAVWCFVLGSAWEVDDDTLINDPQNIKFLNSKNYSTWTAGHNSFFDNKTFKDARAYLLGTTLVHIDDYEGEVHEDRHYPALLDADVPADFAASQKWPGTIGAIRNQEQCGSCWAVSAAEVLSDRLAIKTNRPASPLSPQDMVSCDKGDEGCIGGSLPLAWIYLLTTGIVSDKCFPYESGNGKIPACRNQCANFYESWSSSKVKATTAYAIKGVIAMQKEIMTHGPIQVACLVPKSLLSYKSGVYDPWSSEEPVGGHAVKINGWGVEKGFFWNTDYWHVANSWGTGWGENGFFKIKRGTNACGIEMLGPPMAGIPASPAATLVV